MDITEILITATASFLSSVLFYFLFKKIRTSNSDGKPVPYYGIITEGTCFTLVGDYKDVFIIKKLIDKEKMIFKEFRLSFKESYSFIRNSNKNMVLNLEPDVLYEIIEIKETTVHYGFKKVLFYTKIPNLGIIYPELKNKPTEKLIAK